MLIDIFSIPLSLRKRLLVYSLPLITTTLDISSHPVHPPYFLLSLFAVPLSLLPLPQRSKLLLLTLLHAAACLLRSRALSYAVHGATMAACYDAALRMCLCVYQLRAVYLVLCAEMLGHLLAVFAPRGPAVLCLCAVQLVLLLRVPRLPLEISAGERQRFLPVLYKEIRALHGHDYALLSGEYRMVVEVKYRRRRLRSLFLPAWMLLTPLCFPVLGRVVYAVGPLVPVYRHPLFLVAYVLAVVLGVEVGGVGVAAGLSWVVEWVGEVDGVFGSMWMGVCGRMGMSFVIYSFCYPRWIEELLSVR